MLRVDMRRVAIVVSVPREAGGSIRRVVDT